ncbi:hypothetical protein J6590_104063 [Homalodisca vitripennis]|nr:hypothetical protein J6590_104063 [Homalodisca vitripennis]
MLIDQPQHRKLHIHSFETEHSATGPDHLSPARPICKVEIQGRLGCSWPIGVDGLSIFSCISSSQKGRAGLRWCDHNGRRALAIEVDRKPH